MAHENDVKFEYRLISRLLLDGSHALPFISSVAALMLQWWNTN